MVAGSANPIGRQIARRHRQARRILGEGGPGALATRVVGAMVSRVPTPASVPEVRREDVLRADLTKPLSQLPWDTGDGRMTLNWVMAPPGAGSGGHTTLFRLMTYLEARGHRCRIYLYDVYGGDSEYYEKFIRSYFPAVAATVHDVDDGLAPANAHLATSWATAYPVFNSSAPGRRCYLVQDFEPWFYAASAEAALAENTYRMGFHAITAGRWLAGKLRSEYAMTADHFDFGCDADRYRLENCDQRFGVVFYARRNADRRAFDLGVMALELFAERHPEAELHFYGENVGRLPFQFVDHGLVTPDKLNEIYNRCYAGLSLSMTNVSLVPHEMLASGCIPVVNDADHNRIVLDNPVVRYAPPSPHELVGVLSGIAATSDFAPLAKAASESVRGVSWDDAGNQVESALLRATACTQEADA